MFCLYVLVFILLWMIWRNRIPVVFSSPVVSHAQHVCTLLQVLELPPVEKQRRRRQLIFIDENTQISQDEQRAQIDDVHFETRPLVRNPCFFISSCGFSICRAILTFIYSHETAFDPQWKYRKVRTASCLGQNIKWKNDFNFTLTLNFRLLIKTLFWNLWTLCGSVLLFRKAEVLVDVPTLRTSSPDELLNNPCCGE